MDANADRSRERPRECRLFQAHVVFDGHRAGNVLSYLNCLGLRGGRTDEAARLHDAFKSTLISADFSVGSLKIAIGRMMFFIVFPWIGNEELQCDQTVSGAPAERLFADERRLRATRGI
jgi:hypothetical protein